VASISPNVYFRTENEPYGKVWALRAGDVHQPLRLPGQVAEQFDTGANGATERSYNNFRWYRSGWGRYSQADSIGDIGRNSYEYGLDNALGEIDPLGLWSVSFAYGEGGYAQITIGKLNGVAFLTVSPGVGGASMFSWDPNGGPPTSGLKGGWGMDSKCRSTWISVGGTVQAGVAAIAGYNVGWRGGVKIDQPNLAPYVMLAPNPGLPNWVPILPHFASYGGAFSGWDVEYDPDMKQLISKLLSLREKLKAGFQAGAQVDVTVYSRQDMDPQCRCEGFL
jgi:RHS repeat-associated protein